MADTKQRLKLVEFLKNKKSVTVVNCEVRDSKWGSDLESIMRKNTELQRSPTKFDMSSLVCSGSNETTLDQLAEVTNYQCVSVRVKVVKQKEVVEVKNGLQKQDFVIADATGSTKVTAWEDNVGTLKEGSSYQLSGMMMRLYNGRKYLSIPKDGYEISGIPDIGAVNEVEAEELYNYNYT